MNCLFIESELEHIINMFQKTKACKKINIYGKELLKIHVPFFDDFWSCGCSGSIVS